uniref:SWIM-type domain-containing protein n=1 Tax=Trepomonas sp. PC1 TaxID=1076344 RepID=A0A146K410_9EUKA|eukprot:JAP90311.1 Hypothetical protein TPC1_30194 [Trepomonas sp. PC1]
MEYYQKQKQKSPIFCDFTFGKVQRQKFTIHIIMMQDNVTGITFQLAAVIFFETNEFKATESPKTTKLSMEWIMKHIPELKDTPMVMTDRGTNYVGDDFINYFRKQTESLDQVKTRIDRCYCAIHYFRNMRQKFPSLNTKKQSKIFAIHFYNMCRSGTKYEAQAYKYRMEKLMESAGCNEAEQNQFQKMWNQDASRLCICFRKNKGSGGAIATSAVEGYNWVRLKRNLTRRSKMYDLFLLLSCCDLKAQEHKQNYLKFLKRTEGFKFYDANDQCLEIKIDKPFCQHLKTQIPLLKHIDVLIDGDYVYIRTKTPHLLTEKEFVETQEDSDYSASEELGEVIDEQVTACNTDQDFIEIQQDQQLYDGVNDNNQVDETQDIKDPNFVTTLMFKFHTESVQCMCNTKLVTKMFCVHELAALWKLGKLNKNELQRRCQSSTYCMAFTLESSFQIRKKPAIIPKQIKPIIDLESSSQIQENDQISLQQLSDVDNNIQSHVQPQTSENKQSPTNLNQEQVLRNKFSQLILSEQMPFDKVKQAYKYALQIQDDKLYYQTQKVAATNNPGGMIHFEMHGMPSGKKKGKQLSKFSFK